MYHRLALKKALAGGALQLVATDHAVFNSSQKAVGINDFRIIPNGVNGIEERLHVVWEEMVNSGEGKMKGRLFDQRVLNACDTMHQQDC